ncbi:hypothetical protein F5Y15DRAFT_143424 [Xylariaceae sp. FL0016]|nr:hypothetical protein F5Y15DRAFT_143424 [Xylariaceae sp. FL0016]
MSSVLGKRKARTQSEPKPSKPSVSEEEAADVFKRLFEAQFAPLPDTSQSARSVAIADAEDLRSESDDSDDDSEDSWGGLSEADDDDAEDSQSSAPSPAVEVISHERSAPSLPTSALAKRESKAYLSSRIPNAAPTDASASSAPRSKAKATPMDEDAPSLLKNDLALQRLLSESHLFSAAAKKDPGVEMGAEHKGRNRHLANDMRMAALGSKASIFAQAKMPMGMRKGIAAKAEGRETKRRTEARENGIVLERPVSKKGKSGGGMRKFQRGVDAPAVGKLSNGMLKLSKRDIASIESDGPRRGRGMGGKKRRR